MYWTELNWSVLVQKLYCTSTLIFLTCMILFQVYMLNQALHGYYTDVNWQPLYTGIIINNHRIAISLQNQTKQNQRQEICPLSNSLKNNSRNGFFFSANHYLFWVNWKQLALFFKNQSNFIKFNLTFYLWRRIFKIKCLSNFGKQYIKC